MEKVQEVAQSSSIKKIGKIDSRDFVHLPAFIRWVLETEEKKKEGTPCQMHPSECLAK